ncbi:hypothetical protein [Phaeovulum sp. W22_SRMD_FR3]|uniref:hypothetical protein n=1 Tax=Phaeovulum sp. W22_SRMD_FR3 TaxID=3240274 RepID=UPI003F95539F
MNPGTSVLRHAVASAEASVPQRRSFRLHNLHNDDYRVISSLKFQVFAAASFAALSLSGCVSGGGAATNMVTATSSMRGLIQAQEPPSWEDCALSGGAVNTRISNPYARYAEIEVEQRGRQRQQALVGRIFDGGTTLIGGQAIMRAGSATGIQNAVIATNWGRVGPGSLARTESSTRQLKGVNDAIRISRRFRKSGGEGVTKTPATV